MLGAKDILASTILKTSEISPDRVTEEDTTLKYRTYSVSDIIDKSRTLIHAFMNRQVISFTALLDENFVWLGDSSSQYIQGRDAFLKTITDEIKMPPLELSQEEYTVLIHERHTWVSYGRCTVTSNIGTENLMSCGIHFTLVWKQVKDDMYLTLASATHVLDTQQQDIVPIIPDDSQNSSVPQARVFDHIKASELIHKNTPKIRIRDTSGNLHFLFPDEIIYAHSRGKDCTLHTVNGEIISCMALNSLERPAFLRIHASYLVNRPCITSIHRYEVALIDGSKLPVGKARYNNIIKLLAQN